MSTEISGVVGEFFDAVNRHDTDAIIATFESDAYVNDARHEFAGRDRIRAWVEKEITGDNVTIEPTEVITLHENVIVRGRYDGDYDKTNLPDELLLTHYFTVRDGKIAALIIIFNQPVSY